MSDPTPAEQAVNDQFTEWRTPPIEGDRYPDTDDRGERVVHVSQRFGVPFAGVAEQLDVGEPLTGWVIHELKRSTETKQTIWAWCRVTADKPGYDEITFTHDDGSTPADPGKDFQLGKVVTKVWC